MPSVTDMASDAASSCGGEGESDQYTDDEESAPENDENDENIVWTGYQSKIPVLFFKPEVIARKIPELRAVGERFHLSFKIVKTECKLVRAILQGHGFHEAHPNSNDFNLMWTGSHLKPFVLRSMTEYQKINHFPRSYEITRKDRLFKNIQKMQQTKGFKHFDFVPSSYVLPAEYQDFCSGFLREKGSWIVKPIASSRGRGIFLINHPDQAPLDEQMIVSKYISNPFLIDGYKFDIRLYVAVTSYDPLIVYLYEEGLTRFATVKFDKAARFIRNQMMHLTNYSVNKKNQDFVHNDDAEVEDYGNKWSLGALLRFLKSEGKDVQALMCRIEDVVVKTLVSVEAQVATACKMFMPFRGNCFELYGFDILLDEDLRPWVLEVNLSPSLACDAPLDLKIKANMISDLFSLVGFVCHDPMTRRVAQSKRNMDTASKMAARSLKVRPGSTQSSQRRPSSASSMNSNAGAHSSHKGSLSGLTGEEIRIVRRAKEESKRAGGWVRIFPTNDTWDLYSHFFTSSTTHNHMLHQRLFSDEPPIIKPQNSLGMSTRFSRSIQLHSANDPSAVLASQGNRDFADRAKRRGRCYERKLRSLGRGRRKQRPGQHKRQGGPQTGIFRGRVVPPDTGEDDDVTSTQDTVTSQRGFVTSQAASSMTSQRTNGTSSSKVDDLEVLEPTPLNTEPEPPVQPRYQDQNRDPQLLETRLNLVKYLESGGTLSKVQARTAFATYLTRVKNRLMSELSPGAYGDTDEINEQMDLVLRFLKRAAGNLQHPFKVIVPSRKLPLSDRRRILAKQLGDFVHLYGRETDQLKGNRQADLLRSSSHGNSNQGNNNHDNSNDAVDDQKFTYFLHTACESELEEVLTVYTKVHKSASIFIGSSQAAQTCATPISPPSADSSVTGPTVNGLCGVTRTGGPVPETLPPREPRETREHRHRNRAPAVAPEEADRASSASGQRPYGPGKKVHSSYASAVAIYSGRVRSAGVKVRPASAVTSRMVTEKPAERVMSAGSQRPAVTPVNGQASDTDNTQAPGTLEEEPSEEIMNEALQRLSFRQQQRQYSAKSAKSSNVLTTNNATSTTGGGGGTGTTTIVDATRSPVKLQRSASWMDSRSAENQKLTNGKRGGPMQRLTNYDSPETAVSRFGDSNRVQKKLDVNFHLNELAKRFSMPKNGNMFLRHDFPFWEPDLRKESRLDKLGDSGIKQQRMIEQSKVLLEQSKAKHQAMIAQAHAARSDPKSYQVRQMAPKPPSGQRRKPLSASRLARTGAMEEATVENTRQEQKNYNVW